MRNGENKPQRIQHIGFQQESNTLFESKPTQTISEIDTPLERGWMMTSSRCALAPDITSSWIDALSMSRSSMCLLSESSIVHTKSSSVLDTVQQEKWGWRAVVSSFCFQLLSLVNPWKKSFSLCLIPLQTQPRRMGTASSRDKTM